ncbi:AGC protein kinase [Phytophthora palmivora]|uniref:AGC protein kinase n=1 Tax=Phytophthora palmivora TaxID=4796 RepID=A0A2P4X5Y5_9STRA|nr:AGC protein kinase [Phytophthora palmivora]
MAPVSQSIKSPKAALNYKKWGNVKTWTFAQLLASSFAKVSLEDAMRNGGNSPTLTVEKKQVSNKKESTSGNNDWDCSYSCLKPQSTVPSLNTVTSEIEYSDV